MGVLKVEIINMMLPVAIVLMGLGWSDAVPLSDELAKVSGDRAANMMSMLRLVDVTDRNYNTWWDTFRGLYAEYSARVTMDETLYCSDKDGLDLALKNLAEKIKLVKTGVTALKDQLSQIRAILENVEFDGKTGLQCDDNPTGDVGKILRPLTNWRQRQEKMMKRLRGKLLMWRHFRQQTMNISVVANTRIGLICGVHALAVVVGNTQIETRTIKWQPRNNGTACQDDQLERTRTCNDDCCPVNCEMEEWSPWGVCPDQCWVQPPIITRKRGVIVHDTCNGTPCPEDHLQERICQNPLDLKKQ